MPGIQTHLKSEAGQVFAQTKTLLYIPNQSESWHVIDITSACRYFRTARAAKEISIIGF